MPLRLITFVFALATLSLRAQVTVTYTDGQTGATAYDTSAPNSPLTLTIGAGSATQSGVLSGTGSVAKTGAGTLTLAAANTYTGSTTLSAGTLALSGAGTLGTGTVYLTGGATLDLGGTTQTVAGLGSYNNPVAGNITTGSLTGAGDAYIQSGTFTNTFTDATLIIGGDPTATTYLNGTNDSSSSHYVSLGFGVSAGTVKLGNPNAIAGASQWVDLGGATLDLNGQTNIRADTISFNAGTDSRLVNDSTTQGASYGGTIFLYTDGSPAQLGGAGTLTLTGQIIKWRNPGGGYDIDAGFAKTGAGTLIIATTYGDYDNITVAEGTLQFGDGSSSAGGVVSNIVNHSVVAFNHNAVYGNFIFAMSGSGSVIKNGTDLLELTQTNSYTGGTVLNSGGFLLGADHALGTGLLTINGGSLRAVGSPRTLPNAIVLAGDVTLGRATHLAGDIALTNSVTITSANPAITYATNTSNPGNVGVSTSTISGVISGNHGLTFAEGVNPSDTIILSGANTYTGGTTINAGTVAANNPTGSAFGSGFVTVASGATLSGAGFIGGATMLASGAHLAPGNSPGTLTFTSGLTLNNGTILDFELGSTNDLIRVSGGLLAGSTGSAGITLNLSNAGGFAPATYVLFDFTGATLTNFDATDFVLGTEITGYDYAFVLGGTTLSLVVTAAAIPEPSTYAALAGGLALGFAALRRRLAAPTCPP